jgi:hypothetical protein
VISDKGILASEVHTIPSVEKEKVCTIKVGQRETFNPNTISAKNFFFGSFE